MGHVINKVLMSAENIGTGIEKQETDRIFERFYKTDKCRLRKIDCGKPIKKPFCHSPDFLLKLHIVKFADIIS